MERKDIFKSRSLFISRANKAWRDSSDSNKQKFLNGDPSPPTKRLISFFFKQKETANSANSSLATNTSSVTNYRKVVMELTEPTHISSMITSVNLCLAIENREIFPSEREIQMLKTFFIEVEVSHEQLFTSDVKNGQQLIQLFTTFIYKWDEFKNLQEQCYGAQ